MIGSRNEDGQLCDREAGVAANQKRNHKSQANTTDNNASHLLLTTLPWTWQ
jgi:hypothetical protein